MRICVLKESLEIGGTERSAANISKALESDNEVFTTLFDENNIQYDFGGKLVGFSLPPNRGVLGKALNTFLRHIKLKKFIKKEKIDVLYQFLGIGNIQTKLKYKNTVKVISARDFGAMNTRYNEYRQALSNSNAMICNSEYIKDYYILRCPKDKDKVFTVYNVIDTLEIRKQALEIPEREFMDFVASHRHTAVAVGRFCKEKGFEYLIEAIATARNKNKELGLVLVGDGELRQKYQEVIDKHNLVGHVYFTGFQKNPYKYMSKCTCFVLSSLSEGFPNVLAEAMALSLPVISTNCFSGPAEILRDDCDYNAVTEKFCQCDYGIITPKFNEYENDDSVFQLASAIVFLLSDKELRDKYAKLSFQRAQKFSSIAVKERLNDIFKLLMERKNK